MADPFRGITIVNRRLVPYESMFNSIPIIIGPLEKSSYPPEIAIALVEGSAMRVDAASGVKHTYALGIEGDPNYPADPIETKIMEGGREIDLASDRPLEALDRTAMPPLRHSEPMGLTADGPVDLGLGKRTDLPPADTMKPLAFINPEKKTGPQYGGSDLHGGGSRTISRPHE